MDAEIELGKRGQFDVYVDERRVVSRKGGLMALLTKKPWPSEASVVEAIKSSLVR